ncbi:hypothetical protein [Clostridium sp.]|uniref:Nmad3 family putative nucleotide modification protein n=1 Tax=Clostridium sp. TaxID=1506 RepID=UPI003D6D564F
MKVILSRKGFDSKTGGYASPILPDGTMVSLPIPEFNTSIYYKDLMVNPNLSYLDLMSQLGMSGKYNTNSTAHLDPDTNDSILQRKYAWKAIFGQDNATGGHLKNQNIGTGDIFLFYGWFKNVISATNGYQYDPNDKHGKHIIWAYLQVGEKIEINSQKNYNASYLTHPHFENRNRTNNTAYIASDSLSFDKNISGAGVFKYNKNLVLSCDPNKRSLWELPLFFHPSYNTVVTYRKDIKLWNIKQNTCTLNTNIQAQDFVIYGNPCVEQWAKDIILNNI